MFHALAIRQPIITRDAGSFQLEEMTRTKTKSDKRRKNELKIVDDEKGSNRIAFVTLITFWFISEICVAEKRLLLAGYRPTAVFNFGRLKRA